MAEGGSGSGDGKTYTSTIFSGGLAENYYALLGVSLGADESTIKKAYRKKQLECHPDRTGGGDDMMSKLLNEARDTLLNKEERERYDEEVKVQQDADSYSFFKLSDDPNAVKESDRIKVKLKRWQDEFPHLDFQDNFDKDLNSVLETVASVFQSEYEEESGSSKSKSKSSEFACVVCDESFEDPADHFNRILLPYIHPVERNANGGNGFSIYRKLRETIVTMAKEEEDTRILTVLLEMSAEKSKTENEENFPYYLTPVTPLEKYALVLSKLQWKNWNFLKVEKVILSFLRAIILIQRNSKEGSGATGNLDSDPKYRKFKYIRKYEGLNPEDREFVTTQSQHNFLFNIRSMFRIYKTSEEHVKNAMVAQSQGDDLGVIKHMIWSFRRACCKRHYYQEVSAAILSAISNSLNVNVNANANAETDPSPSIYTDRNLESNCAILYFALYYTSATSLEMTQLAHYLYSLFIQSSNINEDENHVGMEIISSLFSSISAILKMIETKGKGNDQSNAATEPEAQPQVCPNYKPLAPSPSWDSTSFIFPINTGSDSDSLQNIPFDFSKWFQILGSGKMAVESEESVYRSLGPLIEEAVTRSKFEFGANLQTTAIGETALVGIMMVRNMEKIKKWWGMNSFNLESEVKADDVNPSQQQGHSEGVNHHLETIPEYFLHLLCIKFGLWEKSKSIESSNPIEKWNKYLENDNNKEKCREMTLLCILATDMSLQLKAKKLENLNAFYLAAKSYLLDPDEHPVDFFCSKYAQTQSVHYLWAAVQRLEEIPDMSRQVPHCIKLVQDFFISTKSSAATNNENVSRERILQAIIHTFTENVGELFMLPAHILIVQHSSVKFRLLAAMHFIRMHTELDMENSKQGRGQGQWTLWKKLLNERFSQGMDSAISALNILAVSEHLLNLNSDDLELLTTIFYSRNGQQVINNYNNNNNNNKNNSKNNNNNTNYNMRLYIAILHLIWGTIQRIRIRLQQSENTNNNSFSQCLYMGLVGEDLSRLATGLALLQQQSHDEELLPSLNMAPKLFKDKMSKVINFSLDPQSKSKLKSETDLAQLKFRLLSHLPDKNLDVHMNVLKILKGGSFLRRAFRWEEYALGVALTSPLETAFIYLDYEPSLHSRVLAAFFFLKAMKENGEKGEESTGTNMAEIWSYKNMIEELLISIVAYRERLSFFMRHYYSQLGLTLCLHANGVFRQRWELEKLKFKQQQKQQQQQQQQYRGGIGSRQVVRFGESKNPVPRMTVSCPALSQKSKVVITALLLGELQVMRVLPLTGSELTCKVDAIFLQHFGDDFTEKFLELKVNYATCQNEGQGQGQGQRQDFKVGLKVKNHANFQYAQFEEIWKGRSSSDEDSPLYFRNLKLQTMDAILSSQNYKMEDVLRNFHWPFGRRTNYGWRDMTQEGRLLNFSQTQTDPKSTTPFTTIEGFTLCKKTGKLNFHLTKDKSGLTPLFTMTDMLEIFQGGFIQASFTLDDPNYSYTCHPFQDAKYTPRSIQGSRYFATLLQADILLKELTTGVEINYLPPFHSRPTTAKDGLLSPLPPHLQEALQPIHLRDEAKGLSKSSLSAHRFWIDVPFPLVNFEENEHNIKLTFENGADKKLKTIVKKHKLVRNAEGELVDADDDENDNEEKENEDGEKELSKSKSSEWEFARDVSEHWDEISDYFPEFARLDQLMRLSHICKHLLMIREGCQEQIDSLPAKTKGQVHQVLQQVSDQIHPSKFQQEEQRIWADIHQQCRAQNHFLTNSERNELQGKISEKVNQAKREALQSVQNQLVQVFHIRSKSDLHVSVLDGWLISRTQWDTTKVYTVCNEALLSHQMAQVVPLRDSIRDLGVPTVKEMQKMMKSAEEEEKNRKSCSWVPAVFFSSTRLSSDEGEGEGEGGGEGSKSKSSVRHLIHGGVAMGTSRPSSNSGSGSGSSSGGGGGGGGGNRGRGSGSGSGSDNRNRNDPKIEAKHRQLEARRNKHLGRCDSSSADIALYGKPQSTGPRNQVDPFGHAQEISRVAVAAAKAGHKVGVNIAVKTFTRNPHDPKTRPDIIIQHKDSKKIIIIEKASRTDNVQTLQARGERGLSALSEKLRGSVHVCGVDDKIPEEALRQIERGERDISTLFSKYYNAGSGGDNK